MGLDLGDETNLCIQEIAPRGFFNILITRRNAGQPFIQIFARN